MNKWRVRPEHWRYLTQRQQKRMFKTGVRIASTLIVTLVAFSLIVEAMLGL